MRTADIVVRAGDRLPIISQTVQVDGVLLDLTSYSATFNYQPVAGTGALTVRAATISAPTTGVVTYAWSALDAAVIPGLYAAWFEVTTGGSLTLSVPNDGFLLLQIVADGAAEWSYSGDPGARRLDAVRFLIQDTDPANPLQRDAEILWALAQNVNLYRAAASCADTIAMKYASDSNTNRSVGDLSISVQHKGRSKEYTALAVSLRAQATSLGAPMPSAGSVGAIRQFIIGEGDNPSTGLPNFLQPGGGS